MVTTSAMGVTKERSPDGVDALVTTSAGGSLEEVESSAPVTSTGGSLEEVESSVPVNVNTGGSLVEVESSVSVPITTIGCSPSGVEIPVETTRVTKGSSLHEVEAPVTVVAQSRTSLTTPLSAFGVDTYVASYTSTATSTSTPTTPLSAFGVDTYVASYTSTATSTSTRSYGDVLKNVSPRKLHFTDRFTGTLYIRKWKNSRTIRDESGELKEYTTDGEDPDRGIHLPVREGFKATAETRLHAGPQTPTPLQHVSDDPDADRHAMSIACDGALAERNAVVANYTQLLSASNAAVKEQAIFMTAAKRFDNNITGQYRRLRQEFQEVLLLLPSITNTTVEDIRSLSDYVAQVHAEDKVTSDTKDAAEDKS